VKSNSYGQFCSVARAAEIVASRWTLIILRELLAGSTKFNDLRNGVPQMSPSLLSKRLTELHEAGIINKKNAQKGRGYEYFLSDSGKELRPIIETLGVWGQKFVLAEFEKHELDPTLLMWDIQRRIETSFFPEEGRFVAEFLLNGAPVKRKNWWLVITNRSVELCVHHPGFDIDILIEANLKILTNVWMGVCSIEFAKKDNRLVLTGSSKYVRTFEKWFLLSPFAEHHPGNKTF
jgi:DNA-binding HxlR family transcriptional regulator